MQLFIIILRHFKLLLTVNIKYYSYNEIILVMLEGSGEGESTDSSGSVGDTITEPPTPVSAEGKCMQIFRSCMETHNWRPYKSYIMFS